MTNYKTFFQFIRGEGSLITDNLYISKVIHKLHKFVHYDLSENLHSLT